MAQVQAIECLVAVVGELRFLRQVKQAVVIGDVGSGKRIARDTLHSTTAQNIPLTFCILNKKLPTQDDLSKVCIRRAIIILTKCNVQCKFIRQHLVAIASEIDGYLRCIGRGGRRCL